MPYHRFYHIGKPATACGLDRQGDPVVCCVCGSPDCLDYRLEVEPLVPGENAVSAYCCTAHARQWAEKMSGGAK